MRSLMRQLRNHILDIFQPVHSNGVKRITGQAFACLSWRTDGAFWSLESCTEVWHTLVDNETARMEAFLLFSATEYYSYTDTEHPRRTS